MKLDKADLIAFLTVALVFALVQAKGLSHIAPGDENVYYYMAKSVADGQTPYRDFFYAHPPLHLLILSLVIKIFGINFTILKSVTLLALLISSLFLYKTSLELFKNRLNDKHASRISLIALVLFLFSFEVMFKATFSMGINFSLMFLMICFYFLFTKRYFIGGIFAGFACLTRFYTLVPIFAIFIFIIIKKIRENRNKDFFHMLAGFLMSFGIAIVLLITLFGQNFIEPVFKYHLLKPKLPNQKMIVYKNILQENWVILLAFTLSFFVKNKKMFQIFYFVIFMYLLFLLYLKVVAEFYFNIAFPFMAIVGAYCIVDILRKINRPRYFKHCIATLMILVFLWNTAADVMFLEKIGFLEFKPLNQLASKISAADSALKIFGDDSIVPLLALMTNRSIALNFIDSNEKRFTTGLTNFYLFTSELDKADISYIILRENKGLHQIVEINDYVNDRCDLEKEYFDIAEGSFLAYNCNK